MRCGSLLVAAVDHDAAPFRPHAHRQAALVEQLVQMQTGLQLVAARLGMRVQMPPQGDHAIGRFVNRGIESRLPISRHSFTTETQRALR